MVTDYNQKQAPKLENCFLVWDALCHRYEPVGMYYDKNNKILYVPRGIDIWYVKKQVGVKDHRVDKPNPYKVIDNILMKTSPRDDRQVEALKFTCGVGPEHEDNQYLPQLSVNLNTGVGKTYVSIATIAFYRLKSIIITGSNSLLNQWHKNIKEYTNLTDRDILRISGSSMLQMILQNKSKLANEASIFLCTHGTIRSFADEYGWDKLNQVFINLGIGLKFFDEAHQNFENMCKIDFFTNVFKTFYVTATPARSDFRENRVYQISFKNVPFIDLFDEDSDPHTDYLAIRYNSHPNPRLISEFRNAYGLDRNKYTNYITTNENFYKALRVIMDMISRFKGKVLMYIGTNEGILRVYKWICTEYSEYIGDVGLFTSLVDKEDKAKERDKKIILTTTKSAGAGEDIKGLKVTVILAEPFKSEVLARQTLGRTRDPNTLYIELVDMGFNAIRKYYYSKLPTFNTYASSTSDTMIDSYELDRRSEKIIEKRQDKGPTNAPHVYQPIYFRDERFFDYSKEDADENRKPDTNKPINPLEWY